MVREILFVKLVFLFFNLINKDCYILYHLQYRSCINYSSFNLPYLEKEEFITLEKVEISTKLQR